MDYLAQSWPLLLGLALILHNGYPGMAKCSPSLTSFWWPLTVVVLCMTLCTLAIALRTSMWPSYIHDHTACLLCTVYEMDLQLLIVENSVASSTDLSRIYGFFINR